MTKIDSYVRSFDYELRDESNDSYDVSVWLKIANFRYWFERLIKGILCRCPFVFISFESKVGKSNDISKNGLTPNQHRHSFDV